MKKLTTAMATVHTIGNTTSSLICFRRSWNNSSSVIKSRYLSKMPPHINCCNKKLIAIAIKLTFYRIHRKNVVLYETFVPIAKSKFV